MALAALLTTLACDPGDPTSPAAVTSEMSQALQALEFTFPAIDHDLLGRVVVSRDLPAVRPARTENVDSIRATYPFASITGAISDPGFESGAAYVYGRHTFTGNVGRIETTAHAAFQTQHLGDFTATTEQSEQLFYGLFSSDIAAIAKIFTDKTCDLEVQGSSLHHAHWETLAPGLIRWGDVTTTTQGAPRTNGACGQGTGTGGEGGYESEPSGGIVCYYWITYDMDTGEVYDAEFLYCQSGGVLI